MGTLGNQPNFGVYGFTRTQAESFNGTGSATSFTLGHHVKNAIDIEVLVDNVQQSPFDGSYSVSGTTLTFSGAPASGTNNVYVMYRQVGTVIDTQALVPDDNSVTYAKLGNDIPLGNRNLIINGAMQVAQRGTSFTGLQNNPQYAIDRFEFRRIGSWASAQFAVTQESDGPPGFPKSFKLATTTAETDLSSIAGLSTQLEGQNLQSLKWGTTSKESMTLSFWVKSYQTGTYSFVLQATSVNTSVYGSLYTINQSNTWEKKTITIPAPGIASSTAINNDNQNGFELVWHFAKRTSAGELTNNSWDETSNQSGRRWYSVNGQTINGSTSTNNYIQITGVQLEVGTKATPFEYRSYGEELALCQRYFYLKGSGTGFGSAQSGSGAYTRMYALPERHPVEMRATPTFSFISGGSTYFAGGGGITIGTPTGDAGTVQNSVHSLLSINSSTTGVNRLSLGNGFSFQRGQSYVSTANFIEVDAEL